MTNAKNVYALMLALVIVLSGCFGNTTPETDGQSNQNSNIAPLIEVGAHMTTGGTPSYSSTTGDFVGFTEWNVSVYRAVADLDGSIVSAGWDFDLDGTIDHASNAFQAIDNLSIPAAYWSNTSSILPDWNQGQIATIAFIATDDGGMTSAELLTVHNENEEWWWGTTTRNSYTATDASASVSAADDDTLMRITWQHAEDDLNWAFVVIKLTVGDNTFDCSTGADEECSIAQDGGDDALWETGEFLTLSENGNDIASTTTEIGMYVTYRGAIIAGTSDVAVA